MLKGKTAVITGASRGIGKEIALKFAQNGANVAIIYSGSKDEAEKTAQLASGYGVKAIAYCANCADFNRVKEVTKEIINDFSGVDILVNNAGITKDGLLLTMSEADFDAVVGVNLKGVFNFTKHLSRYIIKSAGGRIINISSVSGTNGNAGQANYSASKAGVIGFSKTVAKELAGRGVTVNVIAPGFIETDMTAKLPPSALEGAVSAIPLKRLGKTSDVADLALFLASGAASYITGECIRVDGGMCI
ncbi:MAG: 3-oxoacyl-[acyl-carrier-protein] reductase [Clostridiales bacterium]|nr:3-oxoacyl-[acyl-carrier-protein] reductase [Clostridiales bacterium]